MTRRKYFLLALVPSLLYAAFHFLSPTRQLLSSQERFLAAVSSKNAEAVSGMLDPDYSDQWGFQPADWPGLLQDLRVVSPVLDIKTDEPVGDAGTGVVETALRVLSEGPAASRLGIPAIKTKPTRFIWRRSSWMPWSWRLLSIQNPEIEIPPDYQPGRLSRTAGF